MAKEKLNLLSLPHKTAIQKAFARGSKSIAIQGEGFSLEPLDKGVKFSMGGETVSKTERWIRVRKPGSLTPVAVIERTNACNLRGKTEATA